MRKSFVIGLVLAVGALGACRDDDDNGVTPGQGDGAVPVGADGAAVGTEAGPAAGTTVAEIKKEIVGDGTNVVLKDVVVTAVDGYGTYTGDLYVQDAGGGEYSGIKLYRNQRVDGGEVGDLKPGDRVRVEGTVKHWPGPTSSPFSNGKYVVELEKNSISLLAEGSNPHVDDVSAQQLTQDPDAVKWEGALVRVTDVSVLTLPHPKYADFDVSGGLAVDDDLYPHSPKVGDCISVTGISVYFYDFRINPRSEADVAQGNDCPVTPQIGIRDIQDSSSAKRPQPDEVVMVKGVITAVDSTANSSGKYYNFFVQDGTGPYSGILVYHNWTDGDAMKPRVGDEVELSGSYMEYPPGKADNESVSELKNVSWKVVGTKAVPEAVAVSAADIATGAAKAEEYEGVLVQVQDFEVKAITEDKNGKPVAVTGTSGLVVDHAFFSFFASSPPVVGDKYSSITGPLDFAFGKTRIYPRSADDMVRDTGSIGN